MTTQQKLTAKAAISGTRLIAVGVLAQGEREREREREGGGGGFR